MKSIGDYNDWKPKDFEVEAEPLGKGGYGTVYRATCIRPDFGNKMVAIKKISKKEIQVKKLWKNVEKEVSIHKQLKHPNIVEFYTKFEDENFVYLVLELCKESLDAFLKKGKVPEVSAITIIEEVVKGMLYLHEKKILHRDISTGNILLTNDRKVKICDLGFGTKEDKWLTSRLGTPAFQSPEITNKQPYDYKSDSYSLGVVIFAVLGGTLPMNKYSIDTDKRFSPEAVKLMKDLLEEDPGKRVGIDEVLSYEYFKEYNNRSKFKNHSLRNKDSGMGSINSSSSTDKHQYRSSKYFDSGLDSSNSRHCFPKISWRPNTENMSQNSKERRKRNVSEERQRQERTHYSSEQHILPNYKTHSQYTSSNKKERSVSEERRKQKITYSSLNANGNRSNETRKSNSQTEKCKIDFCKFKDSILEGDFSNDLSPLSLVSERKSQEMNSRNHQESLALNSKHSSCSDQRKKNLPPKSQHGSSSVTQKPQRLNAERLRPFRHTVKNNAVVSLLENGDVYVEWLKIKKKKQFVSEVLHIVSDNKDVIYAYKPKHCLLGAKPPPKPRNLEEIQNFSFDTLPSPHWKLYHIAKSIIDFARSTTPKITYFKEDFKFVMMENSDLEMEFFDGVRIKQISSKVLIIDEIGAIVEDMDDHFGALYEKFINVKALCRKVEEHLDNLDIKFDYPMLFGDSTKYKKNISP